MALTAKVDAILLVGRVKVVKRPMMRELRRLLDVAPAAKLGLVVTDVVGERGYGYASYRDEPARPRWSLRRPARPTPRARRPRTERGDAPEVVTQEAPPAIRASRRR
jgi:hypothetical protein